MKANFLEASKMVHDSSGIDNPWKYTWNKSTANIWYPTKEHGLNITYYLFASEDMVELYESLGIEALVQELKLQDEKYDKLAFIHGETHPNYLLIINSGFVSYCTVTEQDFLKL